MAEININNLSPLTGNMVASDGNVYNIVDILLEGGGSAVIEELNVTPTTSAQVITAPSGTDGYNPVNVSAVTSSIDANIVADNIKNGVTILGVTGTMSGGGYSEFPSYQVSNGVAVRRSGALTGNEFSGITSVGDYGLTYACSYCSGLTGTFDLSSLTSVGSNGLYYAFYNCTGLTSVNLSSLISVGDRGLYYAFYGCTGLTSVDLSSLTSIGSNGFTQAFYNCTGLTSVDFPLLTSVGSSGLFFVFSGCTGLTDVYFRSLNTSSFGTDTNQFNYMMQNTGTTTTHTLHFPSNLQSTISGLTGYPLFSGTSGYVVLSFDLPATE